MYKNYTDKLVEASENCSSCQTLTLVTLSPIREWKVLISRLDIEKNTDMEKINNLLLHNN